MKTEKKIGFEDTHKYLTKDVEVNMTVDLSDTTEIHSSYLGHLINLHTQVNLTIIPGQHFLKLLKRIDLVDYFNLKDA